MVAVRTFMVAGLLSALVACSSTPTEIVVLVDTNIEDELAWIQLRVTAPDGEISSAMATLATTGLPISQSHVVEDGELGPYLFEAIGSQPGGPVVSAAKSASFVSGERRTLRLNLDRSCLLVSCDAGSTCVEGLCGAIETAVLEPYAGTSRHYTDAGLFDSAASEGGSPEGGLSDARIADASVPDACVPKSEVCDEVDNDCDDSVDEDFDLTMDPDNCGSCGAVCRPNVALGVDSAACNASVCTFGCAPNYGDCDGDVTDGCEDLTTQQNCGRCNNRCVGNRDCRSVNMTYSCVR